MWRRGYGKGEFFLCGPCRVKTIEANRSAAVDSSGFVYALRCGPWIKIGTSYDPNERTKNLMRILPPSEVLYVLRGGRALEKQLHRELSAFRVTGEWFHEHIDVISKLISIKREQERE